MADLKKIRAFAFDIDGVMTDGGLLCDLNGELYRCFDAKDGFAVRMASMKGYPVAVITGGRSLTIRARYRTCGLPQETTFPTSKPCRPPAWAPARATRSLKPSPQQTGSLPDPAEKAACARESRSS